MLPVLIGEGIPLVARRHRDISLSLIESSAYPDGVVRIRYKVGAKLDNAALTP
jgi:hypothetical protein